MITLRDRVLTYFLKNPDETLRRADVQVKWEYDYRTVSGALTTMTLDGLVSARRDATGAFVYSIGPTLAEWVAA